jgi:hypothetical protein
MRRTSSVEWGWKMGNISCSQSNPPSQRMRWINWQQEQPTTRPTISNMMNEMGIKWWEFGKPETHMMRTYQRLTSWNYRRQIEALAMTQPKPLAHYKWCNMWHSKLYQHQLTSSGYEARDGDQMRQTESIMWENEDSNLELPPSTQNPYFTEIRDWGAKCELKVWVGT